MTHARSLRGKTARQAALMTAAVVGVALVAAIATPAGPAAVSGAFTYRGTVTRIVDGDTLDVRLTSGKRERVRLIGIDAAERGACYATAASSRVAQLAMSKQVVLKGDATQDTRDRYGRLLAYVWIPGGRDLGYQLISGGFAKVYVFRNPFQRLSAYRNAESVAQTGAVGQWKLCGNPPATTPLPVTPPPVTPPPVTPPPSTACHASYSPCLPIVGDLDCADVRALGVAPVRVLGSDPYRLDGDNDGYGCE